MSKISQKLLTTFMKKDELENGVQKSFQGALGLHKFIKLVADK